MGMSTSGVVIEIQRNLRSLDGKLYHKKHQNRELVTMLECICADGIFLPLTIVYKASAGVEEH